MTIAVVNFIFMPVLAWADIYRFKPAYPIFMMFSMDRAEEGLLKDFSRDWYLSVGPTMITSSILISFLPPIFELICHTCKKKSKERKAQKCESIKEMEMVLAPTNEFSFSFKYCSVIFPIYIAQFFSGSLPFVYVPLACGHMMQYYVDKWIITRVSVLPDTFKTPLVMIVLSHLFQAVTIGIVLIIWIYGSPGILGDSYYFKYDWIEAITDPLINVLGLSDISIDNVTSLWDSILYRIKINIAVFFSVIIIFIYLVISKAYSINTKR